MPGFRGYCAFASEDGHVVSVTIFDDRQSAMRAGDRVREWVVSNLSCGRRKAILTRPGWHWPRRERRSSPGKNAMEANAWVVSVMHERRIAPSPPTVMAGQVVVVAAAEG
jgi:hypothetical protein